MPMPCSPPSRRSPARATPALANTIPKEDRPAADDALYVGPVPDGDEVLYPAQQ